MATLINHTKNTNSNDSNDPQTKKAIEILSACKFSQLNTKTTDSPFFTPTNDSTTRENIIDNSQKDNTTIVDIANRMDLPELLQNMYLCIDSNDREFTYSIFTFFSINEIEKRLNLYKQNNQNDICDLAITYHGMGHIIILAWNVKTKSCFVRRDGGSNDYDRNDNWNFIRGYNAETTPESKQIRIDNLFNDLSEANLDSLSKLCINS